MGLATSAATARRIRNEIFLGDDNGQQVYLLHVQMPQLYKYPSPRMDDDMHRDLFQGQKRRHHSALQGQNSSYSVRDSDKSNIIGMA